MTTGASGATEGVLKGVGVGLAPAVFLYVGVLATYWLATLIRVVSAGLGFFAQINVTTIAIVICLLLTAMGYGVVAVRVFRQARRWREDGETTAANAVLWGLAASALLVLVPVLLAILLPQHPAYIK
jgi:hypothetical protein